MKVVLNVCVPALGVVPLPGVYTKAPATLLDALSCVAESIVPYGIALGVAHVRVGVALATTSDTVSVAVL